VKLYTLVPMDSRLNEWLFWYEDADGYRQPKQIYSDLVCAKCGKLDEVAAINRGVDPNITIRSKRPTCRPGRPEAMKSPCRGGRSLAACLASIIFPV